MNKKCVPEGSFVKCSFAEATNIKRLKVTHNNNVLIYGKKMATEGDKEFLENIPQFDKCKKGECKFCAAGNWEPLGEKAMIGNNRLLLENSQIKCEKGGVLSLYLTLEEMMASESLLSLFNSDFPIGQGMELALLTSLGIGGLGVLPRNLFFNFGMPGFVVYGGKNKRNSQELYREAIEAGLKNGKIKKVEKNGNIYYETTEVINYKNYGSSWSGNFVLTEIDGEMKLFIIRKKVKAISVPFGSFDLNGESPFDYIIKNKKLEDKNIIFVHNHFQNSGKSSYMTKSDMKKVVEYYAYKPNSQKMGDKILNYLREGNEPLYEVSNKWSGSGNSSYNFGSEIEAHADLLVNKTKLTKFIKFVRQKQKNQSDESYFYSVGIADMAKEDKWKPDKVFMDILWGNRMTEEEQEIWYDPAMQGMLHY